jgi:hypothetical protein
MFEPVLGTQEYRVVLLQSKSRSVLALAAGDSFHLPRISVPSMTRPARELQKAIRVTWGIEAFVIDICAEPHGASPCAVAEVRPSINSSGLEEVVLGRIPNSELTGEERRACEALLEGESTTPIARIGWVDEALGWVTSVTGKSFSTEKTEQVNAGGGYALIRLLSDDGRVYWLKSTGVPNKHELSMTACLSGLCPEFLPKLVAIRSDWNAWLTEDAGEPLSTSFADAELVRAARSFACLQIRTTGCVDILLAAGAFDQRIQVLRHHLDRVVLFLIDAMSRQTTTKVAPLSTLRLLELGEILREALCRLKSLGIPDALLHNDLNMGNILDDGTRCVFTDWSEAAVGSPFLSFERFRLMSRDDESDLRRVYGEVCREWISQASMDLAFQLARPLSIFAYLYGRGDWLREPVRITPQFESYARSLARHLDRVARALALEADLCR